MINSRSTTDSTNKTELGNVGVVCIERSFPVCCPHGTHCERVGGKSSRLTRERSEIDYTNMHDERSITHKEEAEVDLRICHVISNMRSHAYAAPNYFSL
jgi:hypothetical protein